MVVAIIVQYAWVGFLEEVLFRGMLLRALLETWPPIGAVLLSAVTFGIGHIVSMLAGVAVLLVYGAWLLFGAGALSRLRQRERTEPAAVR